ncbi:HCP-like protein [Xylaria bambusicola]|uniref:HCP-like protein n=1 Tax=Xylaria bambusicola TaxID=326684 RepID=UPI002007FA28|nr:HCP-like protein [Xylaria bambusicola]KAI0515253.1 HCP-like protein [Xylaria bambusicola]
MATVTTTPPPIATPSPPRSLQRKPLPPSKPSPGSPQLRSSHHHEHQNSIAAEPTTGSLSVRNGLMSSARTGFQPGGNWTQPDSAAVQNGEFEHIRHMSNQDRELPKSPIPPTPPPHSPMHVQARMQHGAPPKQQTLESSISPKFAVDLPHRTGQINANIGVDHVFANTSTSLEQDGESIRDAASSQDPYRQSRESDTTLSTRQQTSTDSSVETSASSLSGGLNETSESQVQCDSMSVKESIIEGTIPEEPPVPQLQYHHQPFQTRVSSVPLEASSRNSSTPDVSESALAINRHLTPNSYYVRRSSLPRPQSSYSLYSDLGQRGRSPALGAPHARAPSQNRRSPDNRASSYGELLNIPYPQPAPAPITFDNSYLRNNVGNNASLLSTQKTLEMYRQNVKKTNDFSIQYSFAVFLISTAQEQGLDYDEPSRRKPSPKQGSQMGGVESSPTELIREAKSILTRLANGGYPFAQYYLADGYASGLFNKGKEDYNAAFPLFVLAAKHGHAESAYRAGLCYEFGWGCRKDPAKAVQFLRSAASKNHPGAMTRLGKACLSGDLGENRYREGIKWLKRATETADAMYNSAPYQLGMMYETGYGDDIFKDENYAAELFTQAAELGHPEAGYRMGDAYEHGKLGCPLDPALSVHFYTGAAERGHAAAMMGLCAWYLVGAEPILEKDEEEAYEWARRSAELGFVKAQYTVGYFTEMGIGCRRDILEANVWYVKAADAGDERAKQRLQAIRLAVSGGTPMDVAPAKSSKMRKSQSKEDKDCVVM